MKRRLYQLWEDFQEWIFWFFIGLAILIVGFLVLAVDLFFKKKTTRFIIEPNPIESYRAWQEENPKTAWLLQWPLRLVEM
jgi:heme/copper-type cytochrome/quinol oxidase subunit 1